MARYVFSSAVLTDYGVWEYAPCTPEQARAWLCAAPFVSCVGYEETAEALTVLTDVPIPCHRRTARLTEQDDALVFRLVFPSGYRPDPARKGAMTLNFVLDNHELGLLKRLA